ncbi:uncharacterized protein BDR25DRAFT_302578 [Lindgomyces ingoldianus]|uniref:Uncharacterized protein n=1 Tax=Lindgomyces ingoldianus TaxID=673940 RepID=A0ACB6QZI8_9PLEO|nr:uncharacterized protein BDR25DRAFT_302578 [Lindgomyces ingoldianus]KAF2472336.1 hypothetical protein BDR25DRAFT_302578 [Lindgomyces ingoldianus]
MTIGYSDLEVAPQTPSTGPVPIKDHSAGLIVESNDTHKIAGEPYYYDPDNNLPPYSQEKPRRICGAERRTFWIVLAIIAVLITAAAVGGGVGGVVSKNKSSTPSSAQTTTPSLSSTSQISTGSTTPTSTSTDIRSTTTLIGPTRTLARDCPSANNSIYDISYGSSSTMSWRKLCNMNFRSVKRTPANPDNVVNTGTKSLNDCINLCASWDQTNQTLIKSGKAFVCNAVCWINTLDADLPGQCFGFTTQNDTSGFVVDETRKCDTAAWINQSFG